MQIIMESKQYSKRIRYLRRLILTTVAAACLIPTCICVILAIRYDRLNTRYEQSEADLAWYREKYGRVRGFHMAVYRPANPGLSGFQSAPELFFFFCII